MNHAFRNNGLGRCSHCEASEGSHATGVTIPDGGVAKSLGFGSPHISGAYAKFGANGIEAGCFITIDGAGSWPISFVIGYPTLRRAAKDTRDEAKRFAKRVASWVD